MYALNRKSFMSLIEVLISLGLISTLLIVLLGFYTDFEWMDSQSKKARIENFRLRYIQSRLNQMIPQALYEDELIGKYKTCFFFSQDTLSQDKLVLIFNNGSKFPPIFSSNVLGLLYLEQNGDLSLAIWPVPKDIAEIASLPMKKEILLQGVKAITMEAFSPSVKTEEKVVETANIETGREKQNPPRDGNWHREWIWQYQELPPMVRVQITLKDRKEPLSFTFFIPDHGPYKESGDGKKTNMEKSILYL